MPGGRQTSLVRRFTGLFLALGGAAVALSAVISFFTLPATPLVTVAANHLEARSHRQAGAFLELVLAAARDLGADVPSSPARTSAWLGAHPFLSSLGWVPAAGPAMPGGPVAVMLVPGPGGAWWGHLDAPRLLAALSADPSSRERGADFLLDPEGKVLAAVPAGATPVSDRRTPLGRVVVVEAQPGGSGLFRRTVALRRPLPGTGLLLVNEEPVSVDLLRLDDRPLLGLVRPFLITVSSTGFLVLAAILAARVVTRPLRRVREGALRIAEGELGHRIEVATRDEVADLARAFNQMAARLQQRERELTENNAELERANRLKTLFLANVSHELRTPLTSIIGFSQALEDGMHGPLSPPQRAVLEKIRRNASALLAHINDLLDVTRIEAGRMELTLERVSLPECIESAWSAVEPQLVARGLRFVPEMPEEDLEVRGDFNRLRQVFVNLLSNAVRFTETGSVGVRLGREDGWARMEVWDEGIGIERGSLAHIFDEFRQADSGIHRRFGGSGLGLAICHKLVRLHGGELAVESRPGQGSCFSVRLRLELTPRSDSPPPHTERMKGRWGVISCSLARRWRMCTSTVRSSPKKSGPQTRSRRCWRDSTCPAWAASTRSRLNSMGVSRTGCPSSSTAWPRTWMRRPPRTRTSSSAGVAAMRRRRNMARTRATTSFGLKGLVR